MRTVLIVDDEFGNVDVLEAALMDEGYRVIVAMNGRRALERLAEIRPDLVISDFMMPLMDGAALGTAMRNDEAYRTIAIIMMSSVPERAVRESFDAYDAFIRKPFLLSELMTLIDSTVVHGRRSDESADPTH